MEARRQVLVASLTPDPASARPFIMTLLGSFTTFGMDAQAAKELTSLYGRALEDTPTWAIEAAGLRFLKCRTLSKWAGSKRPEPPEVVNECRLGMREVEDELSRLSAVLDAEVYNTTITDADRAKLDKVLRDAAANARAARMASRAPEPDPNEVLDRLRHEGMGGKKLSDGVISRVLGGSDASRRAKEGEAA